MLKPKSEVKKIVYIFIFLFITVTLLYIVVREDKAADTKKVLETSVVNNSPDLFALIGNEKFKLEIADSEEEQIKGLSGRKNMPEDTGLLFIFPKKDYWGIWMRDMNFSIDIIWLDENSNIVHIENDVSPETYPYVFRPNKPSWHVLELNKGIIEKYKIKVGDNITLTL